MNDIRPDPQQFCQPAEDAAGKEWQARLRDGAAASRDDRNIHRERLGAQFFADRAREHEACAQWPGEMCEVDGIVDRAHLQVGTIQFQQDFQRFIRHA